MMPKSIDAFLEAATGQGKTGSSCWRQNLQGDALAAVEALEERIKAGDKFQWSRVSLALKTNFDVDILAGAIGRHFLGQCRCE